MHSLVKEKSKVHSHENFIVCAFSRRFKLKALYGFAGGFYLYSIFALVFWETRRSDFAVSMSHHVVSLTLIAMSYLAK